MLADNVYLPATNRATCMRLSSPDKDCLLNNWSSQFKLARPRRLAIFELGAPKTVPGLFEPGTALNPSSYVTNSSHESRRKNDTRTLR